MTDRPVVVRPLARIDVNEAVNYLLAEAGEGVALRFVDALRATYSFISTFPESGSTRYVDVLAMPDLRSQRLAGYPYLVFYIRKPECVEVWRVLHAQRDLPSWLAET